MKVRLRNPDREVQVSGPRRVRELLAELGIDPDTVLVIRDRALLTRDESLDEEDAIEVLYRATVEDHPGVFNVTGPGIVILSQAIKLMGKMNAPVIPPYGGALATAFMRRASRSRARVTSRTRRGRARPRRCRRSG